MLLNKNVIGIINFLQFPFHFRNKFSYFHFIWSSKIEYLIKKEREININILFLMLV